MQVEIRVGPVDDLAGYSEVPIAFEVTSAFDISGRGEDGRLRLIERAIEPTFMKDYDADPHERPVAWAERFDVANWAMVTAWFHDRRLGGAVVAFDTPGVDMLEGRRDLAALWDIRVAPPVRGCGIGGSIFQAAAGWAVQAGCRQMKIETQNNNAAACRFYARMGCRLLEAYPGVYPDWPDEVQMIWGLILERAAHREGEP